MLKVFLLIGLLLTQPVYADEKTEACDAVVKIYNNAVELAIKKVNISIAYNAASYLYEGSSGGFEIVLYIIQKGYDDVQNKKDIKKEGAKLKKLCTSTWMIDYDKEESKHNYF